MKNSADENPTLFGFIKDNMLALLDPAKTWMDSIAMALFFEDRGDEATGS